ncbi:hypothetical protein C8Q72DRAFT_816678 [Fomitopsis betulina]|nr:hypothetical protein C8Q72DRAFT_816678 [Fomitopsis betulina]
MPIFVPTLVFVPFGMGAGHRLDMATRDSEAMSGVLTMDSALFTETVAPCCNNRPPPLRSSRLYQRKTSSTS